MLISTNIPHSIHSHSHSLCQYSYSLDDIYSTFSAGSDKSFESCVDQIERASSGFNHAPGITESSSKHTETGYNLSLSLTSISQSRVEQLTASTDRSRKLYDAASRYSHPADIAHTVLLRKLSSKPVPSQTTVIMNATNSYYGNSTAISSTVPKQFPPHYHRPSAISSVVDLGYYSSSIPSGTRQHSMSVPPSLQQPFTQNQSNMSYSNSRPPSVTVSPIFSQASKDENVRSKTSTSNSIVSYLQIPSSITGSKGSLAEFAAQITCLFWFESSTTLKFIEEADGSPLPAPSLTPEALPATGFLKWVTTMLSTTQVTQNVILLALLFVYRLKKQNPSVKGKLGSEYRLLTVALMLGNKFLDDNTYTNKTWAEVSGISVHEIHVMEVEFLSHMKYNLYTSKEEWQRWHTQLGNFWRYFDQASRRLRHDLPKPLHLRPTLQIPQALPSPPASTKASPPFVSTSSPISAPFSASTVLPPYLGNMAISQRDPLLAFADVENRNYASSGRKRSYDQAAGYEHEESAQAKRPSVYPMKTAYNTDTQRYSHQKSSSNTGPALPSLPNLPVPTLPVPQSNHHQLFSQTLSNTSSPLTRDTIHTPTSSRQNGTPFTHLPPVNWLQAVGSSSGTVLSANHQASGGGGYYTSTPSSYSDASVQRNTPKSASTNSHLPASTAQIPSIAAHTSTQNQLSPSYFLTQRSSPYRPVRNISTLLVPPPQSSIQNPTSAISHDQMSWHPLSKNNSNNEARTGRVPYMNREAWPRTHQLDQWSAAYPVN